MVREERSLEAVNEQGEAKLRRGKADDGKISLRQAEKLMEEHLPYFQKAKSRCDVSQNMLLFKFRKEFTS